MSGTGAAAAIACGEALPMAGTGLAFTLCELVVRGGNVDTSRIDRKTVSARDLASAAAPDLNRAAATAARLMAPRPPLRLDGRELSFDRPLVMGVVNVTPDSFSGDGTANDVALAVERARRFVCEGADLIDIGGESTRPGAKPVSSDEECARVVPVITALADLGVPLSIDTRRAVVMDAAVRAGASIINDISALGDDPASLDVAARSGAAVVLNHKQGTPRTMQKAPAYEDVLLDVYDGLAERIETAVAAGIPRARLIADPGLGFGKTPEHNLQLLGGLTLFQGLGCAILVGASRKSFIGALAGGMGPEARLPGSLAALLAAVQHGANIVRVHDVAETRQALIIWNGITQNA
ncbi:MAG: dihydropteroate synthase [Rhodospirillales bacterium]|nr:dihydropteroate synthase [Rhodospirillales bacterium]